MMKRHTAGFSLIELMVTVLVVAILVSIAVPTYMTSVRKARRTEARSALVDLQAREERYFSTNPSQGYSKLAADLGYAAAGVTTDMTATALPVGTSGYYTVLLSNVAAPTATTTGTYTITATVVSTSDQAKDAACKTFSIDQSGVQNATNSAGATSATIISTCWK